MRSLYGLSLFVLLSFPSLGCGDPGFSDSFEQWKGGTPVGWTADGVSETVHATGKAVQMAYPATLTSRELKVRPGRYLLEMIARGPGDWHNFSRLGMVVRWEGGESARLYATDAASALNAWTVYRKEITIPTGVSRVYLFLAALRYDPEFVEVDEVRLDPL